MSAANGLSHIAFDDKPVIARRKDGTLMAFFFRSVEGDAPPDVARYSGYRVTLQQSRDNGKTWSPDTLIIATPTDQGGFFRQDGMVAVEDDEGEFHLFFLNDAKTGVVPTIEKQVHVPGEGDRPATGTMGKMRLDIWHTRSTHRGTRWPQPRAVWWGYSGSHNSVIQLQTGPHRGRIVLPFSYLTDRTWENRGDGPDEFTFRGQFDCTTIYSDDHGATWQTSPDKLTVPVPDIVSAYGAVEPVIDQLSDGRVWMLIRTQNGRFYESFSSDGANWSEPTATPIISSDSPPTLAKLSDGRIVMFWNACLRFPYAFGGRHVMHAAISEDDGRTWRGVREVARDATRDNPPPKAGDHGMGYPTCVATADDRVIVSTGQGGSKEKGGCTIVEPAWILEKKQRDDFSNGLEAWSTFGTRGVELVPHPEKRGASALEIRRADANWQAAAVWNFPAGDAGRVRTRMLFKEGFGGASFGLTDHFSVPFDIEDEWHNLFHFRVTSSTVPIGQWLTLEFAWEKGEGLMIVKNKPDPSIGETRLSPWGPCYLRIRSTSPAPEAGMVIESVDAEVFF